MLAGRSRGTSPDPLFPVSDFMCGYGAYLDSRWLAAMQVNEDRASVWDVRLGAIAILQWAHGRKGDCTGMVVHRLVAAFVCCRQPDRTMI